MLRNIFHTGVELDLPLFPHCMIWELYARPVVYKLQCVSESPGNLVKLQMRGPMPEVSDQ